MIDLFDLSETQLEPGTYITAETFDQLRPQGFRHLANISDLASDPFDTDSDDERIRHVLAWELGPSNLFMGHPLLGGEVTPASPSLPFMVGLYAFTPATWTPYWDLLIEPSHPAVETIASLLELGSRTHPRWEIWEVRHAPNRYRCWGPVSDPITKFEGSLDETVSHIREWETAYGADHS